MFCDIIKLPGAVSGIRVGHSLVVSSVLEYQDEAFVDPEKSR